VKYIPPSKRCEIPLTLADEQMTGEKRTRLRWGKSAEREGDRSIDREKDVDHEQSKAKGGGDRKQRTDVGKPLGNSKGKAKVPEDDKEEGREGGGGATIWMRDK